MNPFDWRGPAFLGFYLVLALATIALVWQRSRVVGSARMTATDLTHDPYRIATLRGGEQEALRVAIVNLIDRRMIETRDGTLIATRRDGADMLRRPLDRALVAACRNPSPLASVRRHAQVVGALSAYSRELEAGGLLAGPDERRTRRLLVGLALGLLAGVAGLKIAIALSRGHTNVGFLVMLCVIACGVLLTTSDVRVTGAGQSLLKGLQALTQRSKAQVDRLVPGGATNQALLVAAVFGLSALPAAAFPFVEQIFPKPRASSVGSDSSGSSCSSDSSCSSSSCGGGSGCGGCGGD